MKKTIIAIAAALMLAPPAAKAAPCMNFDPDNPHAHHAPAWAVNIDARHHGGLANDDPLWQHATCDAANRTIKWCFVDGSDVDGSGGAGQSCHTVK